MKAPALTNKFAQMMISQTLAKGFELEDISRSGGIALEAISGERLKITPEILGRLCRTTKTMVNDEFYGFTEHRCRVGSFYPFTFETMIREDTLANALERAFRFFALVTDDIKFELLESKGIAKVVITLARPDLDRFHYLQEWWQLVWCHLATWLIGEEVTILAVHFPHVPSVIPQEYEDAFWGPCHFSQADGSFAFPAQFLRRRVTRRLEEIRGMLRPNSMELSTVHGIHRSCKMLVKTKMKECLFKTEALLSIEDLADEFNISSQTLRRRLEAEGTSFRTLKEEVRRDVILAWLAEPDIPIGEVSLRAGFAERNGLARSVRSWVGLSPSEYRSRTMGVAPANGTDALASPEIFEKFELSSELHRRL